MTGELRPSRFMFWSTAPFLVASLVLLPLLVRPPDISGWIALVGCEILALFVLLGFYDTERFWWCWRGVGGIIFAVCIVYLGEMLAAGQWFSDGRRSSPSAFRATCALIAFGFPGLWFAMFGRLTLRAESENDEFDEWPGVEGVDDESDR